MKIASIRSNRAFTLVELIVVISILAIIAVIAMASFNTEGAKDRVRESALNKTQAYLENFKSTYGEYPNPTGRGKKYPKTGCAVSGWQTLVDCFVATGIIESKDNKDYKDISEDPSQDSQGPGDTGLEYTYKYCVNDKANKYRLIALAGKQDNPAYLGEDGKEAEINKRYITKLSGNAKADEVTGCNK